MRKLYIPTSTLNFNNILSSESISPEIFYKRRMFGYSRWLSIPENNIDNAILLYDIPFRFTRPQSDVEDHPMLVEICSMEEFPLIADGIHYCDHTIYLSPWQTRFIFFTEQDRRVTLSLSVNSAETKLVEIYKSRFVINCFSPKNHFNVALNVRLNTSAIEKDYRINKMKGLLYGYYIGALLSISLETTKKYNALRELYNISHAILSLGNHDLTLSQTEKIVSLLANPDILISFYKYFLLSSNNNKSVIDWLNQEYKQIERQTIEKQTYLNPLNKEIIVVDGMLSKISNGLSEDENELVKMWINDTLASSLYNGHISSFKNELSDAITYKARENKQIWENGVVKQSLNQMRRYVRGMESTFQWEKSSISSIAAVIMKGNDWTKLLTFMQSKGMSDYRLAFAFYGELNGFANLTRDFTDNLFELNNRKYVDEVYKEIYGQLLGVDPTLTNNIKEVQEMDSCTTIQKNISEELHIWQNRIRECAERVIKNNKKKLMQSLNKALEQNGENMNYQRFFEILFKQEGWHTSKGKAKPLERMQEYFCNMFISKYFYNDSSAWNIIKELVPKEVQGKLYVDLKWFQKELQNPKDKRKYYKLLDENDNVKTIETFCRLKEKDAQTSYFTKELREQIRQRLLAYYDVDR